jgi:hypothetical protein
LIGLADEFVFYDDVNYTKNDWRNRNRIKTPSGLQWLTIPVERASIGSPIDEATTSGDRWRELHWRSIEQNYCRSPHFERYAEGLQQIYRKEERNLSRVNRSFISAVCGWLGISTPLTDVRDYSPEGEPTTRLVDLCRRAGATAYLTGPTARAYLREELFAEAGLEVKYMDYGNYPEYPQLHGSFEHAVSVVDLLLNTGPDASSFMKWAL